MGKLRDFGNYLWNKITGRDRIQALPGEGKETTDREEIFRLKIQAAAQKNGINEISNGGDLITTILTYLGANSKIVNHKAAKEGLQTFVMGILEQNHLDTRYFAEEDIKKMITAIKQSRVIEGTNIIPFNGREGVHYGIGINSENGSIQLQICDEKNFTMERYFYAINESGKLSVKAKKYKKGYFGYEVSEENDSEYNNKGREQKRKTIKKGLDPETNRRTRVDKAFIRVRHPIYHFVVEQNDIGLNGKKVVVPGPKFKLLKLDTLNSLENLDDSGISFQGNPDIQSYYNQNKVTIDAMLKACGFRDEMPESR